MLLCRLAMIASFLTNIISSREKDIFCLQNSFFIYDCCMVWYVLIWILLGWALWYSLFHFRYSDTNEIDSLRKQYKNNQDGYELLQHEVQELSAQNDILKKKTASLLQQNEDYSKLISELSRYYFHIKEATHKVEELGKLLRVYDSDLDQKLTKVWVEWNNSLRSPSQVPVLKDLWHIKGVTKPLEKKYF